MNRLAIVLAVFFVAGCGGDVTPKGKGTGVDINVNPNNGGDPDAGNNSGADATNNGGSDGGDVVPDGSMSSEDAPSIIEFSANPTSLSEGTSTTLSLIVTDPQGTDDVVAVRLLERSSNASLGNFSADGGGAYSASVSWDDIRAVSDITFDGSGSAMLVAEAIDTAGERSTRVLSLSLSCEEAQAACEGVCGEVSCGGQCLAESDFFGDGSNCGACGNVCGGGEICSGNQCADPEPSGGPCASDEDCGGITGSCQTEAATGIPGGICLLVCSRQGCGAGQECVSVQDRGGNDIPVCVDSCTQTDDCRDNFECQELNGGGMACFPVL